MTYLLTRRKVALVSDWSLVTGHWHCSLFTARFFLEFPLAKGGRKLDRRLSKYFLLSGKSQQTKIMH